MRPGRGRPEGRYGRFDGPPPSRYDDRRPPPPPMGQGRQIFVNQVGNDDRMTNAAPLLR